MSYGVWRRDVIQNPGALIFAQTTLRHFSPKQRLCLCIRSSNRARRNPQDVVFHFCGEARELGFNALLEFGNRGSAILAVQAARIVHQDDVPLHGVSEDCLQLRRKPLVVTLRSGPATVACVHPKERWLMERLQQLRQHPLAVALQDLNVRMAGKPPDCPLCETGVALHGINPVKAIFHRGNHFPVIGSCFDENSQAVPFAIFTHRPLFKQMRRADGLPPEFPVEEVRIVAERFICAIERRAPEQSPESFQAASQERWLHGSAE